MIKAFSVKTNDYMYVLYVSSLIKSVIALHNLINNKIHNKEMEAEIAQKEKEAEEEKKKKEEESAKKAEEMLEKAAESAKKDEK
jgi:26S proteasome regulatory subunit N8